MMKQHGTCNPWEPSGWRTKVSHFYSLLSLSTTNSTYNMPRADIRKDVILFHKHYNLNFLFPNPSHGCIQMTVCAGINSMHVTMWRSWFNWFKWKGSKEPSSSLAT
jgi:hypothetical protein